MGGYRYMCVIRTMGAESNIGLYSHSRTTNKKHEYSYGSMIPSPLPLLLFHPHLSRPPLLLFAFSPRCPCVPTHSFADPHISHSTQPMSHYMIYWSGCRGIVVLGSGGGGGGRSGRGAVGIVAAPTALRAMVVVFPIFTSEALFVVAIGGRRVRRRCL